MSLTLIGLSLVNQLGAVSLFWNSRRTPIGRRHVKTLFRHFSCASTLNILCTTCFNSVLRFFWFPEYRAELYWRLENKRMEKLSKENTPCNGDQTVDQNNNADNYKSKEVGEKVSKLKKMTGRSNKLKYLQGKNDI